MTATPTELTPPGYLPTRVIFGAGSTGRLAELVGDRLAAAPGVLVVVTGRSAKPWLSALIASVRRAPPHRMRVVRSPAYPTVAAVADLLATLRPDPIAGVVGIGGGSVLDVAKVLAWLGGTPVTLGAALAGATPDRPAPTLITVPTVAGSGAEVTATATLWDPASRRKHALAHPALSPAVAVVDPDLTVTVPARVRASAALDALAQGAESSWAVAGDDESRQWALAGAASAAAALDRWPAGGADRVLLSRAALCSGIAIARSRTTLAHALSYPLTAGYGIDHGHACALTLGQVLRFNAGVTAADYADRDGPRAVRERVESLCAALGVGDADEAGALFRTLIRRTGLNLLADRPDVDADQVARAASGYDRAGNNPRHCDAETAATLLRAAAAE